MPTYEYQCNSCDEEFELRRKRKEPSPVVCPACGKEDCKKLISASSFHLKGGGWYDEGYGSSSMKNEKKKKDRVERSSKDEKTSSKSTEKSESKSTKSDEKSSPKTETKSKTKSDD